MPSPLLLVQAILNRNIVTAEDETGEKFHNIAEVEEGGRSSRPRDRGLLSQFRRRHGTSRSEADAKGEGPSSSSPDQEQDFADEDALDEEDEDGEIFDTDGLTPRSDGTDGVPSPALRGADSNSASSPALTPTHQTPTGQTPRKRTIRHHDEENGRGGNSESTKREDGFSPIKRTGTGGSNSTWSWVPQPKTPGPIRKALKKTKDFIFQTDPAGDKEGNEFIPNYRYMPILSGVLSPFAILLEIPGLTEHWYIRTENHQVVEVRKNPAIVMIAMSVSMACGLIANLALIARFLERRVKLNTWLAMIVLVIHDIINIIVVTAFGIIHRFDDGFTYGEAFWMCVCSTIFSVTVTATLAYDLITTPEFAKSGSGLTRKQRSLVIMVMILLCYIALGSLAFAELIGLTFQDGLYYTVVSIETIGFGDITPNSTGSIIFCIIYSTVGIINVGLVVNTTRETIIEAFENAYRKRSAEIARRRHEHKVMRVQQRERRIAIEKELHEAGLPIYVRESADVGKHHIGGGRGYMINNHNTKLVLNEAGLEGWRKKRAEERAKKARDPENTEVVLHDLEVPDQKLDADARKGRALVAAMELKTELAMSADDPDKDQGETYADFRRRIHKEERREFITKLIVAWTFFILFWITGAGIFMATEAEWTFGRSLYFCWMSFSTIGYGEIVPKSPAGRAVFVVWALMGVAAMTILIAVLSEAYSSRYKSALQKGSFSKAMKSFEGKEAQRGKSHDSEKSPRESFHLANEEAQHDVELENATCPSDLAQKILDSTRRHLDSIPLSVITHAKTFHDHVRYFANHPQYPHEPPPTSLTDLLDEIAESEKMDERMKQELLGDEEARKALFFMSYERAFRKLIDTAERAVEIIAVKDFEWERLVEILKEHEGTPIDTPKYEHPTQRPQRTATTAGMTLRQREKSKNNDEEAQDEKPPRRSLGAS
ncbi:hypothetical protein M407DRAFT_17341 [Tulasnella calospora MUT 4182]|uniref:Potassium channel domain-containing protein n=1 Tax=Tulasnella calospora MUT 4182 TaxID=1051891 RepID=A0A0C3QVQ0_9AGAM|nr:hypothetical protein M407DRAFT_17341 [Tulasnella calospora MUT 4182]